MPPPRIEQLSEEIREDSLERFVELMMRGLSAGSIARTPYVPWDKLRYLKPPEGMNHKEWWLVTKLARRSVRRTLPFKDTEGMEFSFALPDEMLKMLDAINSKASGNISISEQVTNPATRDRYLVNSLMEEAITSSQLEGASTERGVAKEMIRSGRDPRDRSERMILNNYLAMSRVSELTKEKLTPELICEIHGIVTDGTLDNPDASGRFQTEGDERVRVEDTYGEVLHTPPPAKELPDRMQLLCDFANGHGDAYIPPVLRAITIHFMLGYDHPFEDGNGRTARILFYWSMLSQGYWLTEFLAISRILKKAPAKYARSYLHTEQDDNDLTYFHMYHLNVCDRALRELDEYLTRKMNELRSFQQSLKTIPGEFNHRQIALLTNAVTHPGQHYTAASHSRSHNVTTETARQDLSDLEKRRLLNRGKRGHAFYWSPVDNISEVLKQPKK
jgi:Fic family protein